SFLQCRPYRGPQVIAAGGKMQQRLGGTIPAVGRAFDQELADRLCTWRTAGLAGRRDGSSTGLEPCLEPGDLRRLSCSLSAFQGYETPWRPIAHDSQPNR